MEAAEEMRRCYGITPGKTCRMCANWHMERCEKTTGRSKCPPYELACGKFKEPESLAG